MKKFMGAVLCLALALFLAACGTKPAEVVPPDEGGAEKTDGGEILQNEETKETEPEEREHDLRENDGMIDEDVPLEIAMYAAENNCGGKETAFELKNNSDRAYTYDASYALEERSDGEWREIELEEPLVWTSIAFELAPKSSARFIVDWPFGYGELSAGTYRLRKSVCDPDGTRFTVYAVFEISQAGQEPGMDTITAAKTGDGLSDGAMLSEADTAVLCGLIAAEQNWINDVSKCAVSCRLVLTDASGGKTTYNYCDYGVLDDLDDQKTLQLTPEGRDTFNAILSRYLTLGESVQKPEPDGRGDDSAQVLCGLPLAPEGFSEQKK